MLGIAVAPAEPSPDSDAAIDLESQRGIGIQQLERGRTFPTPPTSPRVYVNPCLAIEKICQRSDHRNRRDRLQGINDLLLAVASPHDFGIHAII